MAGVSQTNSSNTADADGVSTVFNFTFFVYSTDDIKVYSVLDDVLTPITVGITKNLNSSFIGGNVTFSVAPADAVGDILIRREVPYTQETEFADITRYKETAIEEALNTIVLQVQQLAEDVSLCIKYNETAGATDATLEEPEDGATLAYDGTTGRIKKGATQTEIENAQGYALSAESDLAATEADLGAVETDLAATEADILATAADKTATEADIVTVEADLADVETDRTDTEADRTNTEADIIATAADKTATEADLTAVEADAGAVETDLAAVETDLADVETDRTNTEADIIATAADKTATEADLVAVEADAAAVETDLTAVEADLAAVEADLAVAIARVSVTDSGSQTFALVDADTVQIYTGAGGHTWTIPAEGTVAFPNDSEIDGFNNTANNLTLTAAASVVINGVTAGSVVVPPRTGFNLKNYSGNNWIHSGFAADSWA